MKKAFAILCFVTVVFGAIGCSQSETTGTDTPPATTENKTEGTPGATSEGTPAGATAEMAECAECKTQVAKADLKDHDGKMLCAKCIEAHNH